MGDDGKDAAGAQGMIRVARMIGIVPRMAENGREWWEMYEQESLGFKSLLDFIGANGGFLRSFTQLVKTVHRCSVAGESVGRLGWQGWLARWFSQLLLCVSCLAFRGPTRYLPQRVSEGLVWAI